MTGEEGQAEDINIEGEETLEGASEAETTESPVQEAGSQDEGEQLKALLEGEKDKYLRLLAEFENYKRRAIKDRGDLLKYQGEQLITELLEVLDNLDLALTYSSAEHEKLVSGLQMVQKMFTDKLEKWGVKGESCVGKDFDPVKHSAISKVPGGDNKPGTIVGELKKPYYYKDKLIRVGEVVVATEN